MNFGFNLQINIEKVVGTGEAKSVICNAAKKLGVDTLVMGSHGYGFIKRYCLVTWFFLVFLRNLGVCEFNGVIKFYGVNLQDTTWKCE